MIGALAALARGAALGFGTSACFGPATVASMRLSVARRYRAGLLCGAGAATTEGVQAYAAYLGAAEIVQRFPLAVHCFSIVAGVLLVGTALRPAVPSNPTADRGPLREGLRAFGQGALLVGLNPFPLLAWIALSGVVFGQLEPGPAILGAVGVAAGVFAWFAFVIGLLRRGHDVIGTRAGRVGRVLDFVLGASGAVLVLRGAVALAL